MSSRLTTFAFLAILIATVQSVHADEPAWTRAADRKPAMTVDEAKAFIRRLAEHVVEHHLKKDANSPQRGMIYEYFWVAKKGTPQQWIQGEALDTMHDGAWFACAMVNAYRATGDAFYKDVLTKWQLPFYLKMLNHSDELFTSERNDAHPDKRAIWANGKEWLLQGREKGFVPYWWDDGASVSLERLGKKEPRAFYPCRDELAGQPNPEFRLSGYSFGSSNHKAQDLACLLELSWLLLKDTDDAEDRKLADEVAQAARQLQECRTRHGSAGIPIVLAAAGLTQRDAELLRRVPEESWKSVFLQRNHFQRATIDYQPDQRAFTPGFADDQQYRYYFSIARSGTLTEPVAWRCVYDAYTEGRMLDAYYDDAPRPAGINRFDLYPFAFVNGKPEHLRSERKGPSKRPVPVGSRMGPQNMICCGWALQALKTYPGAWDQALAEAGAKRLGLQQSDGKPVTREQVARWLERELGGGLRTWEAVFDEYGYVPTGIGCQTVFGETTWDAFSDTGGYAHLISAAAQWILHLDGKQDWEAHHIPRLSLDRQSK